jgi:hypothetical protein
MALLADSIAKAAYSDFEFFGRARIAKHWIMKARVTGPGIAPVVFQFRLGEDGGRWTVREAMNLTGKKSAWSK